MDAGYQLLEPGLARQVAGPAYGRQDLGYCPGGAQDQFAMATGNLLLGQAADTPCLEFALWPPKLCFTMPGCLVLTGAARGAELWRAGQAMAIPHATICQVQAGDELQFAKGPAHYGLRSTLCWRPGQHPALAGRVRGPFPMIATWPDPQRQIRVLRGPEYAVLSRPQAFLVAAWIISPQSNDIGLRLLGPPLTDTAPRMISQPVADGTIQLSPAGPIVLLRQRPTIGGYPRVFNVISADLDLLAQHAPGQRLRLREVTLAEAQRLARQRAADLAAFAQRWATAAAAAATEPRMDARARE